MRGLIAFFVGGVFGTGLLISGMTDTTKVIGWLDVFGAWDPTLAFVLGGAIIPMFFAWRYAASRAPAMGGEFPKRPDPALSRDLIVGSTLFGAGWGLAGLCPGPAMASATWGGLNGAAFLGAMILGMIIARPIKARFTASMAQGI